MDSTPQKTNWWSEFLENGTGQVELDIDDVDSSVEDHYEEDSLP